MVRFLWGNLTNSFMKSLYIWESGMSAQDNIEKILRNLHVMLSKSEVYPKEPSKVIVDKQQFVELLSELNKSIYEIMDEYELTTQSRERAERAFHKKGDEIVWDASRKAEDIYAASVMYTDEVLNNVQDIMKKATESVEDIYNEMNKRLQEQTKVVRENQSELKSQLQDLRDTEKYLRLIEDRNREIAREKAEKENKRIENKPSIYANRQTQVKVNTEVLEKLGLSSAEQEEPETGADAKNDTKDVEAEIQINLDADYFRWKESQSTEKEST